MLAHSRGVARARPATPGVQRCRSIWCVFPSSGLLRFPHPCSWVIGEGAALLHRGSARSGTMLAIPTSPRGDEGGEYEQREDDVLPAISAMSAASIAASAPAARAWHARRRGQRRSVIDAVPDHEDRAAIQGEPTRPGPAS